MSDKNSCKRCGYVASRGDLLVNHLKRKNTCLPKLSDVSVEELLKTLRTRDVNALNKETMTYNCNFCARSYKTCAGKCYHVKRCPKNPAIYKNPTVPNAEISELRDEIKELREEIRRRDGCYGTTTTTTIGSNNTITNNINILDFGKENTAGLSYEFLKDCLYRCQPIETLPEDGENGLAKLIKHIHSIPENRNVRVRNQNMCLMEKRQGNKWVTVDKNAVLDDMMSNGYQIIDKFKSRNRDDLEDDILFQGVIEEIDEYLDEVASNNKHVIGPIKRDIYIMLVNEKDKEIVVLERK